MEIKNNEADKLCGIINSRIQNIFNTKRDCILQYYAFGIVGMVLFLETYFVILLKQSLILLKNFSFYNICHLSSAVLSLGVAYLSVNILGQMFAFISALFFICPIVKVQE